MSPFYFGPYPEFRKDASLSILDQNDQTEKTSIDIELAATYKAQMLGLMHRQSMEEHQGMLFIMEENEIQSFWMLNTYIHLDIIFIDENKKIISIQEGVPESLRQVTSPGPAKYVLEVNKNLCVKNGIRSGDLVIW